MNFPLRPLGRTGLSVTELGFGTAPLGNLFRPLSEEDARATLAGVSTNPSRVGSSPDQRISVRIASCTCSGTAIFIERLRKS